MRIQSRARGLTFIEVLIASAVLCVILLVALQGTATTEITVTDTNDQVVAQNTANNLMQFLLETSWLDNYDSATTTFTSPNGAAPGILNYLHYSTFPIVGVRLTPGGPSVFGTINSFSVPVPGYPANNTLGTFWVTEATNAECPGYGNPPAMGPRWNGTYVSGPVRGTTTPTLPKLVPYAPPNAPTMLQIIVQVNIPPVTAGQTPYPGVPATSTAVYGASAAVKTSSRPPTLIQLQSLRSSL